MKRRQATYALAVAAVLLTARGAGLRAAQDPVQLSVSPLYSSSDKIRVQLMSAEYERLTDNWINQDPSVVNMLNHSRANPDVHPLVQLGAGSLYETIGLFVEAQEQIQAIIKGKARKEAEPGAFFTLQKVYYQAGEYARSASSYSFVAKHPQFRKLDEARYLAGQAYLRLNAPDQAVEVLNQVDISTRWGAYARYSLAVAYTQLNRMDEAVRAYREAIVLADRTVKAGGIEVAERVVTVLRARGPGSENAEEQVVQGSETIRTTLTPLTDSELKALEGLRSRAQIGLGYHYLQFKQYQQAFDALSAVPETDAYFIEALYAKAWALIYQKRLTEAIVLLNSLLKRSRTGQFAYEAYLVVGSCFMNLGAYDRAIKSYRSAQELYKREREVVRAVAEADFFRDRFDLIRSYFILEREGARDPFGLAESRLTDFDQLVYANIVSNPVVRDSYTQFDDIGRYLGALNDRRDNLVRYQIMIDDKLRTVARVADVLDKEWTPRFKDLLEDFTQLDDRINAKGRRFDIWAMASPKETMLLRDLQTKKNAIQEIETDLKGVQGQVGSVSSRLQADAAQDITSRVAASGDRVEKLKRMQRLRAGEAIWKIVAVDPTQRVSREAGIETRQRRDVARIKQEIDRVQRRIEQLRDDVDRVRNRHRDMKVRANDLQARVKQVLDRTERLYVNLVDQLNRAVVAEYKNHDERLERFDLEASYGILTALDKQTGR